MVRMWVLVLVLVRALMLMLVLVVPAETLPRDGEPTQASAPRL